MSLVLETGAGLPTANAYADVAFVDTYHAERGAAGWSSLDAAAKDQAIVRATDAVDGMFRRRFSGFRAYPTQALEWPRVGASYSDGRLIYDEVNQYPTSSREPSFDGVLSGIPLALKKAVAEAALIEALSPGALSPSFDRGGRIAQESFKGMTTTYESGAPAGTVWSKIMFPIGCLLTTGAEVSR
jgi:hypothetical protein